MLISAGIFRKCFFIILSVLGSLNILQAASLDTDTSELSDLELGKFVSALKKVNAAQKSFEAKMIEELHKSGLDIESFNKLVNAAPDSKPDSAKQQKFEALILKLEDLKEKMQIDLQEIVVSVGLELERYQEIREMLEHNQELRHTVKQKIK